MPVFNQDPKINANANIITANSKEELPDPSTVKPNTVALIPSVAQSVYVYDSLDAAAAANLPEGSLVAVPVNDDVVDLTGVFNFVTSITAGGAKQTVDYDCAEIVERFKKGAVNIKVALADATATQYCFAQMLSENTAQVLSFVDYQGTLLYINTIFAVETGHIIYSCNQVTTTAFNPS